MQIIFNYLNDLTHNNNREWYKEHEAERKKALTVLEHLLQQIIDDLALKEHQLQI